MKGTRLRFKCIDCKIDTGKIGEHYMLKDDIWFSIHPSKNGMLCLNCLEKRLHRPLTINDFNDSHINKILPNRKYSSKLIKILTTPKH